MGCHNRGNTKTPEQIQNEQWLDFQSEDVPIECQDTPGKAIARFTEGFNRGMNPNHPMPYSATEMQHEACERAKDRAAMEQGNQRLVDAITGQNQGCKSDKDCKGERVCEQGNCITPLKHCNDVQSGPCHTD